MQMKKMENLFLCSHRKIDICAMNFSECTPECKWHRKCEHCLNYHIPAGQYPCSKCDCLRIDLKPPL